MENFQKMLQVASQTEVVASTGASSCNCGCTDLRRSKKFAGLLSQKKFCRKKSFDLRFFCQFSKTPSCVILGERVFAFEVMAWYCWCFWERIGKHLWQYTMKPQNMAVGMVQLTYCYTNCRVKEFNKDNYWALMPTTLDQMKQPDFLHNIQALYLELVHCDCSSSSSAGMFGMFRGGCWPPISTSPISARYRCMNACMPWSSLHRQAAIRATSNAANMITGSSNESGRRVLYNFFNVQWYSDRMHQNKVNKPSWGRHAYAPGQKEDTEDMYSCIDMFFFFCGLGGWCWRKISWSASWHAEDRAQGNHLQPHRAIQFQVDKPAYIVISEDTPKVV